MKQRGSRRKNSTSCRIRLPAPSSPLMILCTKTDEAHARVVTPIIRRGRIGKSARRVALRILSLSNRASAPSDPSEDLCCCRLFVFFATIVARIYWKVPLFFFFFVHSSRVPLSMSSMSFVEDSNEDELIRFSAF